VCFDPPTSRATSSALRPASNCFRAPIICGSVCSSSTYPLPLSPTQINSALCGNRGASQFNATKTNILEYTQSRPKNEKNNVPCFERNRNLLPTISEYLQACRARFVLSAVDVFRKWLCPPPWTGGGTLAPREALSGGNAKESAVPNQIVARSI
jgi:hypothetical protein